MSYLVEAYAPASASIAELEQRARLAAAEMPRAGSPIRYRHSILIPADETCFHLFDACSADLVRAAIERVGLRPHRIVEAFTAEDAVRELREERAVARVTDDNAKSELGRSARLGRSSNG
jgi:hypothetical protein